MNNFVAKSLVLVHTILSLGAMCWALLLFVQAKDYGGTEPRKEVLEYSADGTPTKSVRHASAYDKSVVALKEAARTRDGMYTFVKPALDSIRDTEPFLHHNHLHYLAEMKRLRESPDKIEVRRLKDGGLWLDVPLGKPVPDDAKVVSEVSKSFRVYQVDLKKVNDEITKLEEEIRIQVNETKKFTAELTGTDEKNKYVEPGIYNLTDREFKAQTQLKIEIDYIKPHWSKAIEQANLYMFRRVDLEATLLKLKGPPPAPKVDKKL